MKPQKLFVNVTIKNVPAKLLEDMENYEIVMADLYKVLAKKKAVLELS